jgi:RNA polymerase sigma factor (sigma-70 family)
MIFFEGARRSLGGLHIHKHPAVSSWPSSWQQEYPVIRKRNPWQSPAARAAFDSLHKAFRGSLRRYFARRVRDDSEAEDLVQEVFERLAKRDEPVEGERVGGYVFETANSVFTDRLRRRRSRRADVHEQFDEQVHGETVASPEQLILERERVARATEALLELPERTRVIFVLRRLEGMPYLSIAAQLEISVSAVEKHIERAVRHLAERMDPR